MLTSGDATPVAEPGVAMEELYFKRGTHA
jgi:hypothetical protein